MSHFDLTRSDIFSMYGPSYLFQNNNTLGGPSSVPTGLQQPTLHPAFYSYPHLPGLYRDHVFPHFYQPPGSNHVVYNTLRQVSHPPGDLTHLPYDRALYQSGMGELGFSHGFGPPNINFSSPVPTLETKVEVRSASSLDFKFYGVPNNRDLISSEVKPRKRPGSALDAKTKHRKHVKAPQKERAGGCDTTPLSALKKSVDVEVEDLPVGAPEAEKTSPVTDTENSPEICTTAITSCEVKLELCHSERNSDRKMLDNYLTTLNRAKSCEPTASEALDLSLRPRSKTLAAGSKLEASTPRSFSLKSSRLEKSVVAIRRYQDRVDRHYGVPSEEQTSTVENVPDNTCGSSVFIGPSLSRVEDLHSEEEPEGTKDSSKINYSHPAEENREPFSNGGCSRTTPFAKVVFSCKQVLDKSSVFCVETLAHGSDSSVAISRDARTYDEQKPQQPSQLASLIPTHQGAANDISDLIKDKNIPGTGVVNSILCSVSESSEVKTDHGSPEMLRGLKASPIPLCEEVKVHQSPLSVDTGKLSSYCGNFFSPGHGIYPNSPKENMKLKSPVSVKSELSANDSLKSLQRKDQPKESVKVKNEKEHDAKKSGCLMPKKQGSIPVGIAVARQRTTVTTTTVNNTKSKTTSSVRHGNVPLAPRHTESRPLLVQIAPATSISIQNTAVSAPAWAAPVGTSADQQVGISQQSVWVGPATAFTTGSDVTQMILPPSLPIGYQMPTGSSPLLLIPAACLDPSQRPSIFWPSYQPTWTTASPLLSLGPHQQTFQPTTVRIQHHTSYRMVAPMQQDMMDSRCFGEEVQKVDLTESQEIKTAPCVTQSYVTQETMQTTTSVVGYMSPIDSQETLQKPTVTGGENYRVTFRIGKQNEPAGEAFQPIIKFEVPDVSAHINDDKKDDTTSVYIPPKQDAVIQTDTPVSSDDDYESEIENLCEEEDETKKNTGHGSVAPVEKINWGSEIYTPNSPLVVSVEATVSDVSESVTCTLSRCGERDGNAPFDGTPENMHEFCKSQRAGVSRGVDVEFRTLEVSDIGLTCFPVTCDERSVMKVRETRVPEQMKVQETISQSPDLSGLKLLMESIDKVEARKCEPCDGLDLLSAVAEERLLEKRKSDASRTTFESLCVVASTFCDNPSPTGAELLEPVTPSKTTDNNLFMDPSELDMRIRMAELQRKYREKQRELHRLDQRSPTRRKSASRKLSTSETRPKKMPVEEGKRRSKSASGSEEDDAVFHDLSDNQQSITSRTQTSSSKKRKLGFPKKNASKSETTETIVPKKSKIYGIMLNNNEDEWKPKAKPKFRAELKVRTPSPEVEADLFDPSSGPCTTTFLSTVTEALLKLPEPSSEQSKPKPKSPKPSKKIQPIEPAPLPENKEPRAPKEEELQERLRVLVLNEELLSAGHVTLISPPDIYGVVLDGERKNRPRIYSREELLNEAILEVKTLSPEDTAPGTRVCAFWSHSSKVLYPGRVSISQNPLEQTKGKQWLLDIDFDDGDSGKIPLEDVRILPEDYPVKEYNRDPLKAFERHRRRRDSSLDVAVTKATVVPFEIRKESIDDKSQSVELGDEKRVKRKKKKEKERKKEKHKHKKHKRTKEKERKEHKVSTQHEAFEADRVERKLSSPDAPDCYGLMPHLVSEVSLNPDNHHESSASPRKLKKKRKDKEKHQGDRKRHKSEAARKYKDHLLHMPYGVSDAPLLFQSLSQPRRRMTCSETSCVLNLNDPGEIQAAHTVVLFERTAKIEVEPTETEIVVASSHVTVSIQPDIPCALEKTSPILEEMETHLAVVADGTATSVVETVEPETSEVEVSEPQEIQDCANNVASVEPSLQESGGTTVDPVLEAEERIEETLVDKVLEEADDLDEDSTDEEGVITPGRPLCAWEWHGPGTKRKGKIYYKAMKRGEEVIRNGECALFYSMATASDEDARPYIGRIVSMWSNHKASRDVDVVKVFWLYFPEDIDKSVRPNAIPEGGLFESAHPDENLLQTIDRKVEVLPVTEYRSRISSEVEDISDLYYSAGFYNIKTRQLIIEPNVFEEP